LVEEVTLSVKELYFWRSSAEISHGFRSHTLTASKSYMTLAIDLSTGALSHRHRERKSTIDKPSYILNLSTVLLTELTKYFKVLAD